MLGVKVSRRVESGSFVDMGYSLIIYVSTTTSSLYPLSYASCLQ
jgi:hypothetical protein